MQTCLFCGGDASERGHAARCDGQQGKVEARAEDDTMHATSLPVLASGLTAETFSTSVAAAASVEDTRATQRRLVLQAIREAGPEGRTDDELQVALDLDGSSERPRRWELWKQDQIRMRRDGDSVVHRRTRTNRQAVVWVVPEHEMPHGHC